MLVGAIVRVNGDKIHGIHKEAIDGSLDSLYQALEVDTIDIVVRKIGNKYYDIVCDDNGLLYDDDKIVVSAISPTNKPMLVGNLFVCHHNEAGELTSLNDGEFSEIVENSIVCVDLRSGKHSKVLKIDF